MPESAPRPATLHHLPRRSGSGRGLFVLGLAVGLLCAMLVERMTRLFLDGDLELVRSVRDFALEEFVEEVDARELTDDALRGMLAGLDGYSHYYGADELPQLDRETSGEFRGLGVVFRRTEPVRVLFAYPGSPADEAGLGVGDRIVELDGQDVSGLVAEELLPLLHRDSERVSLGVEDLDGGRRTLQLAADVVLDPTVRHVRILDRERRVGYLAIRSFSHRTLEEFDAAVETLRRDDMAALVVDLRSNPGGIMEAAVKIANRFVDGGTLVTQQMRSKTRVSEALPAEAHLLGLPLVLLIDDSSASASEVLAAALQDHCAAVLVGEPSYGKGTVQTLKRLAHDRGEVKLTTAIYLSPAQRRIERDPEHPEKGGVAPDLLVPASMEEKEAVYRFLSSHSPPESALPALRAWERREEVSLIQEPPADRQLDAAVAVLGGRTLDLHVSELR